jgi:hypothetical protein
MTKCTERELLEQAVEWRDKLFANPMDEEAWEALIGEDGCLDNDARAFLADTPACDAEKAVLVGALEGLFAYIEEMAERTAGQPKEMLPDKRLGTANRALADPSPAAAALLAQGEEKKKLERTLARAQRIIGELHIERGELIQRLAALAPQEETK